MKNLLTFIFLTVSVSSFGQTQGTEFNIDSSKTIFKVDFEKLVDTCIILLETKQLKDISDSQHINIMMTLNTIGIKNYEGGRYAKLEKLSREKNYVKEIINVYPEWSPNRGMGYYFPKLKMELYGTPRPYAVYHVTKEKTADNKNIK